MIGKDESPWRQYRLPGNLDVRRIHIYSKDGILFTSRHSFLQDEGIDVEAIDIPAPVKANKVNFKRSDCFYVPCKDDPWERGRMADLYIPEQIAPVTIGPEQSEDSAAGEHSMGYYRPATIRLGAIIRAYTGEKDHRGDHIRKEKRIETIHERTASRWELTKTGQEAKKEHEQMKALGIDIDFGAVLELMKYYDVKLKP